MEFEAVDEGTVGKILVDEGTEGVKVNTPIAVLLAEGESADDIGDLVRARAGRERRRQQAEPAEASGGDGARRRATAGAKPSDAAAPPRQARSAAARAFGESGSSPRPSPAGSRRTRDSTSRRSRGPARRAGSSRPTSRRPSPAPQPAAADAAAKPAPGETDQDRANRPGAEQVIKMYEGREYTEVKLDGMRKTIAARLTEAKQTIPHFYLRRDIRLDALLKFRAELNKQLEARGVKLSVNDFIIKACALALQQVPKANAVWAGDRVLELKPSDVAVAVAIEGGLFTPVLKDAHMKSLSALSAEMKDLAKRARDRKLAPHEYQGGSFAVSNLGMFGIDNFDAVINPPHGAILAVGAGVKKPVVGDDGAVADGDGDERDAVGRSPGDRRRAGCRAAQVDRRQPGKPDRDAGLTRLAFALPLLLAATTASAADERLPSPEACDAVRQRVQVALGQARPRLAG